MRNIAATSILLLAACAGAETPSTSQQPPVLGPTAPIATPATVQGAGGGAAPAAPVPVATTPVMNTAPVANPVPATKANPLPATSPTAAVPAAQPTQPTAATMPAATPGATANSADPTKLALDECGLHTKYAGDNYCILPPPTDKGFQLHIGPSNYDNPEAKYVLAPGEENVVNMTAVTSNDKDVVYYYRQYRMRPGSHHVILTADGKRIGGSQNLARDNPVNGIIPPENMDIGLTLGPHANVNANMHFYNFSDKPMLREMWVNYWYKDPSTVKQTAKSIFSMTGVSAAVAHSHVVVGASCAVTGSGHILTLQGHRHLNNVRFSVWHVAGGQRKLIFDDYDAEHPASLEYNSLVMNPMSDAATKTAGGASGIIDLKQGDTLDFECEIVNNTNKNFFGANEAADDEMCILTGDTVGASVSGACTPTASRTVAGTTTTTK